MRDIYAELTDKVIAGLEAGVRPWFKPWGSPQGDVFTRPLRWNGKPYHGVNVLSLWVTAELCGYTNPYWMTFPQAIELGGHVRKGEHGTQIIFVGAKTIDAGTDDERSISIARGSTVFNVEQIDGLPEKYYPKTTTRVERPANAPIPAAEEFFANLDMDVRHGGDQAYYSPSKDYVQLPRLENFQTAEDYYVTKAHETIHWTRHEKRLNRSFDQKRWGDEGYAIEELVAELGSVFLAADLGIAAQPRADHADYIAVWLKVLKNDKRAIVSAASFAEKAADYLHQQQPGYVVPEEDEPRPAKPKAKAKGKSKRRSR